MWVGVWVGGGEKEKDGTNKIGGRVGGRGKKGGRERKRGREGKGGRKEKGWGILLR